MLNNLLNLFNLIKIGSRRQTLEGSDLFMLGVKNGQYDGDYRPAIISWQDLINYINLNVASGGQFTYIKNASSAFEGVDFSVVNNTTFDTTVNNTLSITVEWNAADPLNSIYTEIVTLSKTY